jgi:hypothetical protein
VSDAIHGLHESVFGEDRIRFRVERTVTLEPLWYDRQWHEELMADGMSDQEALIEMVRLGMQEDPTSLLWEAFGTPPEMAEGFAASITRAEVVR